MGQFIGHMAFIISGMALFTFLLFLANYRCTANQLIISPQKTLKEFLKIVVLPLYRMLAQLALGWLARCR
jgi:hypothetical protein